MEIKYREETPERCVKAMNKSGKLVLAVIGIALGVILLIFGSRIGGQENPPASEVSPNGAITRTTDEYRADLESRMEYICGQMAGVGSVEVIVTLEGGFEYVYAYDVKTTVGGESTSYITIGSGDDESLVYITERAPAITGIGVVCTGGMDAAIRREITALLSAAFGVGSNKIYVTGRK